MKVGDVVGPMNLHPEDPGWGTAVVIESLDPDPWVGQLTFVAKNDAGVVFGIGAHTHYVVKTLEEKAAEKLMEAR